jgi:thiamine-phosphate pyrophosphorylase
VTTRNTLPQSPVIYLITQRLAFPHPRSAEAQLDAIDIAARSGCQLIQVRERDLEARELAAFVSRVIEVARPWGSRVLVNDRVDVAIATGADGVHLRSSSLLPGEARRLADNCGRGEFLVGASVHSSEEARAAVTGADFLVCGPVFETQEKRQYGPPLGLDVFEAIASTAGIPVLGIGGIDVSNYKDVLGRGAAGIAGISLFNEIERIESNVKAILSRELKL